MSLPTLLDAGDRAAILDRLHRLRPDARAQWGKLDPPRLLTHLGDQLRVATGKLPTVPTHTWFTRSIGRMVVVNTSLKAPRGKVETAPEMLSTAPAAWAADMDTVTTLAEEVAQGRCVAVHPAFGPLSPQEWGRICWKHLDHHLTQFGV
ncbi:MAG TPA: DUF1569 domain-containing protein [Gemmatimonadales bacterium]|nr:DUF1569 domain-containing protein [Gemmatimonadales bacterium]